MKHKKNWKTQEGSLLLVGQLATVAPRQIAVAMPEIVPLLSSCMLDGKDQVRKAAKKAMTDISLIIGNRDIEEFVPELVSCITKPALVPDCVHKLSGITFVQSVQAPALSIMVPLLIRGMKERATITRRRTVVVIDNMLRLVEDPVETAPFLPQLIPGVERVSEETADPECRATGSKIVKALKGMKQEIEAEENEETLKKSDPEMILSVLKNSISSGAREEAEKPFFGITLNYVSRMCSVLVASKCFEYEGTLLVHTLWYTVLFPRILTFSPYFAEWNNCVSPYLEPFLSPWGEDPESLTKSFLEKIIELTMNKVDLAEDDDEGEDLCNCEFSLGYGGKILLSATRLWLKRGRRYGLCGQNGVGKSTLMRSIAAGKLDGFPPQDVLRTVYVEHDLDSTLVDLNPVEYLLSQEGLKGVQEEEVRQVLSQVGFTEAMTTSPIAKLSGGWKMKLALVRAQLLKADILLLGNSAFSLGI